jgi:endonuclease I
MRAFICVVLTLSSFLSVGLGQGTGQPAGQPAGQPTSQQVITDSIRKDYPDCGASTYYSNKDESSLTRQELHDLLKKTHRNELSVDAVFQALIELDATAGVPGQVDLIYSAESVSAADFGQPDTWTREHLWADSRGAVGGFAFTDVHNNRPENTRVIAIKKEMLYGECGTVEYADACEKPAFTAGPPSGEQDGKVWAPPENMRGDVARALFYMDLRYDDKDLNLTLTDCPPFAGKMGVLSQLLAWHAADPVSDEEAARNQNACRYWQGNRNPFVDFPALVAKFYGQPQEIDPGSRTYPSCLNIPTPAPTAELNDCNELQPGDIFIYVVESDDPDGVGFMALEDIPAGLELFMTDNAWTGTTFLSTEGVVKVRRMTL